MENTDSSKAEGALVTAIWRLELARARHVLRAYLRTRCARRPRTAEQFGGQAAPCMRRLHCSSLSGHCSMLAGKDMRNQCAQLGARAA